MDTRIKLPYEIIKLMAKGIRWLIEKILRK